MLLLVLQVIEIIMFMLPRINIGILELMFFLTPKDPKCGYQKVFIKLFCRNAPIESGFRIVDVHDI